MVKPRDSVRSPPALVAAIELEFGKCYDPVPYNPKWNPIDFKNGLTTDWESPAYVNPPYSETRKWYFKAHEQWKKGVTVIMLAKNKNLSAKYARKTVPGAELRFLPAQTFPGYTKPAAFGSLLLIWRAGEHSEKYSLK